MSNIARGKTYTLPTTASGYPDSGGELTDGIIPTVTPSSPGWVGFDAGNPVVMIDLGSSQIVHIVVVAMLALASSSIALPSNVLVEVGNGVASWATLGNITPSGTDGAITLSKLTSGAGITNRYVRLTFTRVNTLLVGEIGVYDDNSLFPLELFSTADAPTATPSTSNLNASVQTGNLAGAVLGNAPLLSSNVINGQPKPNQIQANVEVKAFAGAQLVYPTQPNQTVTLPNPNIRFENEFANVPDLILAGFNSNFGLSSPTRLTGRSKLEDDIRRLVLRVLLEQGLLKATVTNTDFAIIAASIQNELANGDNWWLGQAAPVRATAFSVGLALPDYSSITARGDGSVDVVVRYERVTAAAVVQGEGVGELLIPFEMSVVG
jgi:hypothetical protein